MGAVYRVFGLRLGPNLGVRPAADKKFHLRLTVENMCIFAVFTNKHLRLYGSVTPILRLQLSVDTQRLKYITLPLKYKTIKIKLKFIIKSISALSATHFLFTVNWFSCKLPITPTVRIKKQIEKL